MSARLVSKHPKNLTSGEGGMVTTNDKDIHDRVCAFMNVGRAPGGARWEYPRLGWNYRPSEYLAAILLVRLERLEVQTDRRNRNAAYLSDALDAIDGITPATTCTVGYEARLSPLLPEVSS